MKKLFWISILFILTGHQIVNAKILSIYTSINGAVKEASLIVIGTVTEIKPFEENKLATIRIKSVLKGDTKLKTVNVFFYGDLPREKLTSSVDGEVRILQFKKGDEMLVFLQKQSPNTEHYRVVYYDHGKLTISKTTKGQFIEIPYFFQKNDKLKESEPLQKIIELTVC